MNLDGLVTVSDLTAVIVAWGACGASNRCDCPEDVPGDGTVDVGDLVLVILSWGDCVPEQASAAFNHCVEQCATNPNCVVRCAEYYGYID